MTESSRSPRLGLRATHLFLMTAVAAASLALAQPAAAQVRTYVFAGTVTGISGDQPVHFVPAIANSGFVVGSSVLYRVKIDRSRVGTTTFVSGSSFDFLPVGGVSYHAEYAGGDSVEGQYQPGVTEYNYAYEITPGPCTGPNACAGLGVGNQLTLNRLDDVDVADWAPGDMFTSFDFATAGSLSGAIEADVMLLEVREAPTPGSLAPLLLLALIGVAHRMRPHAS